MTQEQKTELRERYEKERERMKREEQLRKKKAESDWLDYISGVSRSIARSMARHKRR